jgi:hypothetical protein
LRIDGAGRWSIRFTRRADTKAGKAVRE